MMCLKFFFFFFLRDIDTHIFFGSVNVIKFFPCSILLSIKIFLLKNANMPTIVGILTFTSRKKAF